MNETSTRKFFPVNLATEIRMLAGTLNVTNWQRQVTIIFRDVPKNWFSLHGLAKKALTWEMFESINVLNFEVATSRSFEVTKFTEYAGLPPVKGDRLRMNKDEPITSLIESVDKLMPDDNK